MPAVRVLAAIDKFRGTVSASEAAAAIAAAVRQFGGTCVELPVADGGEGTLEALGGPNRMTTVMGPLGDTVEAQWRLSGHLPRAPMAPANSSLPRLKPERAA
jgi:glycerate kinase